MKIFLILVGVIALNACTSSKDAILGEPSTTTEAVLEQGVTESPSIEQQQWLDSFRTPAIGLDRDIEFNQGRGIAALAINTTYLPNPKRVLYFYPRVTALGNLEPSRAVEYSTYKELHVDTSVRGR